MTVVSHHRQRPFMLPTALVGLALLLSLIWFSTRPARAADLVADLSKHLVAITTGFTGSDVLLFGAVEGKGDVIIVVRGPSKDVVVRRKSQLGGIWINDDSVIFRGVPSYYAIAATKPLERLIPASLARSEQLGAHNLRVTDRKGRAIPQKSPFFQALLRGKQRQGLFPKSTRNVAFLGQQLFRTSVFFPANVPTGTYSVRVLLVRNKQIVGAQTIPLQVSKVGINAQVYDFAHRNALWYGLLAIFIAAVTGWVASQIFRKS